MVNNDQRNLRQQFAARLLQILIASAACGIGALELTNLLNGGKIASLATNPGQALLYSALFSVFLWVFNFAFNSIVQYDRLNDSRKTREEIRQLRAAVERLAN